MPKTAFSPSEKSSLREELYPPSYKAIGVFNRFVSFDTSRITGSNPNPAPEYNNDDYHYFGVHIFSTEYVAAAAYDNSLEPNFYLTVYRFN